MFFRNSEDWGNEFLDTRPFITDDENWVNYFEPESTQQLSFWKRAKKKMGTRVLYKYALQDVPANGYVGAHVHISLLLCTFST